MKRLLIIFLTAILMLISGCTSDNPSTGDESSRNMRETFSTEDFSRPDDVESLSEKENTTPSQSNESTAGIYPTTEQRSDADTVDVSKADTPPEPKSTENHTPPSESKMPTDISVSIPSAKTPPATENPPVTRLPESEEIKEQEPIDPNPPSVNPSQTTSKPEWNIKKIQKECIQTAQDMGYTLNESLTVDNSSWWNPVSISISDEEEYIRRILSEYIGFHTPDNLSLYGLGEITCFNIYSEKGDEETYRIYFLFA